MLSMIDRASEDYRAKKSNAWLLACAPVFYGLVQEAFEHFEETGDWMADADWLNRAKQMLKTIPLRFEFAPFPFSLVTSDDEYGLIDGAGIELCKRDGSDVLMTESDIELMNILSKAPEFFMLTKRVSVHEGLSGAQLDQWMKNTKSVLDSL